MRRTFAHDEFAALIVSAGGGLPSGPGLAGERLGGLTRRTRSHFKVHCHAQTVKSMSTMMESLRHLPRMTALILAAALIAFAGQAVAAGLIEVPPGNRHATQPPIPAGAIARTRETRGNFQAKYEKIRDMIARNRQLQAKIKRAAAHYDIDPIHIVGALIGEHTYNVDALDYIQTYVVKAASYLGSGLTFAYDGEKVTQFIQRPQFALCSVYSDSYDLWSCREGVWEDTFRGQDGRRQDLAQ